MSKVKKENYIVIQGWMLTDLELKGNELIVYAIIYGFSQNGEGQHYIGSLQYLADWTNSTKQGVMKNLKSLIEKGLIGKEEKFINGVKFCEYYATLFNTPMQQSLPEGMQQSLPNNIDPNNTIENNNIEYKAPTPEPKKPKKVKDEPVKSEYGEYKHVLLTDKEFEKLKKDFGEIMRDKAITFLDEYMEMNPKYNKNNHNLVIRNWVIDAVKEREQKQQRVSRSNAPANTPAKNNRFNNFEGRNNNLEAMVWENFRKKQENPPKTAAEDEGIRARAEALKKQFV